MALTAIDGTMSGIKPRIDEGSSKQAIKGPSEDSLLQAVHEELRKHEQLRSNQTYLEKAANLFYNPSEASLKNLTELKKDLERPDKKTGEGLKQFKEKVEKAIETDRKDLERELKISALAAQVLSVAPMFIPGPIGLLGSAALNALNTARPQDGWKQQTLDLTFGSLKGAAFKNIYSLGRALPGGHVAAAGLLTPAQTALDMGLNSHTYVDYSGRRDLPSGLHRVMTQTFDPSFLAANLAGALLAGKAVGSVNRMMSGAIVESPLFSTLATGGIYGFSSGISSSVRNSLFHDTPLNATGILTQGLEQSAIGVVTALPGALVAGWKARGEALRGYESGDRVHTIKSDAGVERGLRVHTPAQSATTSGASKTMCVIALHGCGMNAETMARLTKMNEMADRHNFTIAYLEGSPFLGDNRYRIWNVPKWTTVNRARYEEDLQLIRDARKFMIEKYNADPKQIHAIGYSAGGMLLTDLAAKDAHLFSSVATVAAIPRQTDAVPPNHPSMFQVFLERDRLMAKNGRHANFLALTSRKEYLQTLLNGLNTSGKPVVVRNGNTVSITSENGAREIKQLLVRGPLGRSAFSRWLGHEWPRAELGPYSATPDITEFLLRQNNRQSSAKINH